jgi:hypothetical protein
MSENNLEYNLPQNAYVNFDAVSLKQFIIQRLNEHSSFTDQNYEGSNLSFLIEIMAYYTHVLMFYLNQNSSESLFDQTAIYENMNRIVKLIGYKPTGAQTSIVPINCTASATLPIGSYILRKYSYFLIDNIQYTILNDFSFEKTTAASETINSINNNLILHQGTVQEYPLYTATGTEFETFPIVVDNLVDKSDKRFIAHGSISVYVKTVDDGIWKLYDEVDNLYLATATSQSYELRLNESGHYEVKFGNGVFGKKINASDEVKVLYLLSDGIKGIIGKSAINGNKLFTYNSSLFNQIYNDTTSTTSSTIITAPIASALAFTNPLNSSPLGESESIASIRNNAPLFLAAQYRLVTEEDYEKYLLKSLPNILNTVKVVDNEAFINDYIDYFYRICVDPNKVNRVLINQVNFADSCDFNNVNVFAVPRFETLFDNTYPNFLSESFKNLIIELTKDKKMISNEIVPRDPIYMAYDIGFSTNSPSLDVLTSSKLVITRQKNNKVNGAVLKSKINDAILNFFKPTNNQLGQILNLNDLTASILQIDGVSTIRTENTDGTFFNGVSLLTWNPVYPTADIEIVTQTITLPFYKFPYFNSPQSLINKIEITDV